MSLKGGEMETTILQDGSQMMDWMSQIFTIFQGHDIDQTITYVDFQTYYLKKMENYDSMFDYLGEIFEIEKSESVELNTQEKKRAAKKIIRDKEIYKANVAKWDQKLEKERDIWVTKDKSATSKIKLSVGPSYKSQIDSQKLETAFSIWNFLKEEGAKSYGGARFAAYFDFFSFGYGNE